MKLRIIHETEYQFTSEVFLEPHYLRLKPRTAPHNRLESFMLAITPGPAGLSHQSDEEENLVHFCWFEGMTRSLSIRTESVVITEPYNPFNFIIHPAIFSQLPFEYADHQKKLLEPDLNHPALSNLLIGYGSKIADRSSYNTITFLTDLTRQIHDDFVLEYREVGFPHQPNEAFALKQGSCRDIAWMQINLLRSMGIAARFVSGYYYFEMEKPQFELHAWLEAFLPGAGWVGFDPSHGIIAGPTHIPIVSSSNYENTMPVTGTIRGDAGASLAAKVTIEEMDK